MNYQLEKTVMEHITDADTDIEKDIYFHKQESHRKWPQILASHLQNRKY